jgi:membrane-bound lytic murein transglycosylase D
LPLLGNIRAADLQERMRWTIRVSLLLAGTWLVYGQSAVDSLQLVNPGLAEPADAPISAGQDIVDLQNGPAPMLPSSGSSETNALLARADKHFQTGRQLYFDGDLAAARREFDAALEVLLSAPDSLPDRERIERRIEDLSDLIYRFDVEKLGSGESGEEASTEFDQAPIDELSHMTFPVDPSLAPKVQAELHQTASGIPLDLTPQVLSAIHFFLTEHGRKILLAGYQRSGRHRDMIARIFAQEGIPQELIYLAQEESGFLPRAVSRRRAVGMWQFTAARAADSDLVHTTSYDARLDPEASTRAAAKFLKELYQRYGDWYLAMAAYDAGPGTVDNAVARTGYADYWELVRLNALPKETQNYVPIIIAMTIMAKNPKDYGLEDIQLDPPLEYDTIQLTAPTNINLLADAAMQPISVIRELNPALLKTIAPAGVMVHVPKGTGPATLAALEAVPVENRQAWRIHHVERGETLEAVAKAYHVTPERILAVNRGVDSLEAGDVLLIPAVYHAPEAHSYVRKAHPVKSASKAGAIHNGVHISASRHVPIRVIHHPAVVRTASLQ